MFKHDRSTAELVKRLKESRQEVCTSSAHGRHDRQTGETMLGWGGLKAERKDLDGSQGAEIDFQPTVLGHVAFSVRATTQSANSAKPHSKTVYVEADIEEIRLFAQLLHEAADQAEKHQEAERRRDKRPPRPNLRLV